MKCFKHNKEEAVGSCTKCGKGICNSCAVDVMKTLYCKDCASEGNIRTRDVNTSSRVRKDPGIAALLSLVFIGAGQIYNGQLDKFVLLWGLSLMVIIVSTVLMWLFVGCVTILAVIPIWLYGIYDAYNSAVELNRQNGHDN